MVQTEVKRSVSNRDDVGDNNNDENDRPSKSPIPCSTSNDGAGNSSVDESGTLNNEPLLEYVETARVSLEDSRDFQPPIIVYRELSPKMLTTCIDQSIPMNCCAIITTLYQSIRAR